MAVGGLAALSCDSEGFDFWAAPAVGAYVVVRVVFCSASFCSLPLLATSNSPLRSTPLDTSRAPPYSVALCSGVASPPAARRRSGPLRAAPAFSALLFSISSASFGELGAPRPPL